MAIIEHRCGRKSNAEEYQNTIYGNGRVVATEGKGQYTCTICGEQVKNPKVIRN